jgi:hypothetical protein
MEAKKEGKKKEKENENLQTEEAVEGRGSLKKSDSESNESAFVSLKGSR